MVKILFRQCFRRLFGQCPKTSWTLFRRRVHSLFNLNVTKRLRMLHNNTRMITLSHYWQNGNMKSGWICGEVFRKPCTHVIWILIREQMSTITTYTSLRSSVCSALPHYRSEVRLRIWARFIQLFIASGVDKICTGLALEVNIGSSASGWQFDQYSTPGHMVKKAEFGTSGHDPL